MIKTERLRLREPRIEDAEPLLAVFGDPLAMRYIGDGSVRTLEQVRASIAKKRACLTEHGVTLFTVEVRATGEIIGDCGVFPIAWTEPEFELAYRFKPSAWGLGYATEAGAAALEHAFAATDLEQILGLTDPGNDASQRVLTRLGFADRGITNEYYNKTLRLFVMLRAREP